MFANGFNILKGNGNAQSFIDGIENAFLTVHLAVSKAQSSFDGSGNV